MAGLPFRRCRFRLTSAALCRSPNGPTAASISRQPRLAPSEKPRIPRWPKFHSCFLMAKSPAGLRTAYICGPSFFFEDQRPSNPESSLPSYRGFSFPSEYTDEDGMILTLTTTSSGTPAAAADAWFIQLETSRLAGSTNSLAPARPKPKRDSL